MKRTIIVVIIALFAVHSAADFASDCLNAQNAYRTPLNIAPLTWSDKIAKSAQAWADNLAAQGGLIHSESQYGENLASRTGHYTPDVSSSGSSSSSPDTQSTSQTSSPSASETSSPSASEASSPSTSEISNSSNTTSSGSDSQSTNNLPQDSFSGNSLPDTSSSGISSQNMQDSPVDYYGDEGQGYNYIESNNGNGSDGSYYSGNDNNYESQYNDGGNGDNYDSRYHRSENGRHGRSRRRRHSRNLVEESSDATSLVGELIKQWGDEKQYFVYGTYPNVSPSGEAVGHYTQMVWGDTKQVGCGIANSNDGWVYLVCQYYPAGNMDGEQVY